MISGLLNQRLQFFVTLLFGRSDDALCLLLFIITECVGTVVFEQSAIRGDIRRESEFVLVMGDGGRANEPAGSKATRWTYVARVLAGAGVSDSASDDSVSDSEKFLKKRPLMLCFRFSVSNHVASFWLDEISTSTGRTARTDQVDGVCLPKFGRLN